MASAVVLLAGTVCTGMMAGLFFAYAASVVLALRAVGDRTYVDVMQRVNRAIQNGWFALVFLGAFVLPAVGALLAGRAGQADVAAWAVAGLGCYVLALATTFGVNIPLNNRLDRAGPASEIADPRAVRRAFEARWNRYNLLRTAFSILAFVLLCRALLLAG